jgi:hypothetical protein
MTVDRKDLLEAIKRCMIATTKDANVLGSHTIAFNKTTLQAYNDVIGVSVDFTTDITACVDATKLYLAVNNFTHDTVALSVKDDKVVLKSGKATASLSIQDVSIAYRIRTIAVQFEEVNTTPLPVDFSSLLANAVLNHDNPKLIGVYVAGCDIVCTSGICIYHAIFEGNTEPFRLPNKIVSVVAKQQLDSVAVVNTWVKFQSGNTIYYGRQFDRTAYPIAQTRKVVDGFNSGKVLASVECTPELVNALKVAKQYTDPIQPICSVGFGKDAGVKVSTTQNAYEEFIENTTGEGVYKLRPDMLLFLTKDTDSLSVIEFDGRKAFVATKEGVTIIHAVMEV